MPISFIVWIHASGYSLACSTRLTSGLTCSSTNSATVSIIICSSALTPISASLSSSGCAVSAVTGCLQPSDLVPVASVPIFAKRFVGWNKVGRCKQGLACTARSLMSQDRRSASGRECSTVLLGQFGIVLDEDRCPIDPDQIVDEFDGGTVALFQDDHVLRFVESAPLDIIGIRVGVGLPQVGLTPLLEEHPEGQQSSPR